MTDMNPLTTQGTFVVGCNYWSSHAGTAMWKDWRRDVVADDLRKLAEAGVQVLRVFPLWPDFQPLTQLGTGSGPVEFRHGEDPLPDTLAGQAGMSDAMLERFGEFADLAAQHGLKLIVGLITGWMSGRLFVPPALEGRNVLTDPVAVLWETRFVKHFVRCFRNHTAVLAWDLGNECNCMAQANREQFWVWTSAIVNAIRAEDQSRPIVSGMHSLLPGPNTPWRIQDQGELTDVLTAHPYPYFTPYCDNDPINTMRTELHSTAESRMYADIGGKPCLVEEIGTLGPMVATEKIAADFIRVAMLSAWAHDCHGLLWWCAFELGHLSHAPYDWDAYERELGLFHHDGSPKPVLGEIGRFGQFIKSLPIPSLPLRKTEAVCILSEGQDQWAVAYSSFVLAKQAGFDIEFQYADQPLKDAPFYLLPCISGGRIIYRRRWLELLDRVKAGATLYVSHDNGMLSPLNEPFGIDVVTRSRRADATTVTINGIHGAPAFITNAPFRLHLATTRAEVLGREVDGNPVFTRATWGKGAIYFLSVPIEKELTQTPGSFDPPQTVWQIYRHMAQPFMADRVVSKEHPQIGITEHTLGDRRIVILINYSPEPVTTNITLAPGWKLEASWYGATPALLATGMRCEFPPNDAVVIVVVRQ